MKQKLFWADLAVCSLWLLAIFGNRFWMYSSVASIITLMVAVERTTFAFAFRRGDKRAWIPFALSIGGTLLTICLSGYLRIGNMTYYIFPIFGIDYNTTAHYLIIGAVGAWLGLLPIATYLPALLRKKLSRTELTKRDLFGAILWHDSRARIYSALMLITIATMFAGLSMFTKMCCFACLVAPTLCYYIIARHYHIAVRRMWLMVVAMGVFFRAQPTAGMWRVVMLCVSLAIVGYMCSRFYTAKKLLLVSAIATIYLGILLPSMAIGYNQYACLNYARGNIFSFTLSPYRGIFYIKNQEGHYGLRDRYSLLVEPEYDYIQPHSTNLWNDDYELQKNGYYSIYDVWENSLFQDDAINHELQDSICKITDNHLDAFEYDYNDKLEVAVKEYATDGTISHIKVEKNGSSVYDYSKEPYILADSIATKPGEFASDTAKHTLSYSYDVEMNGIPVYNISILSMREDKLPTHQELQSLAKEIERLLVKSKIPNSDK